MSYLGLVKKVSYSSVHFILNFNHPGPIVGKICSSENVKGRVSKCYKLWRCFVMFNSLQKHATGVKTSGGQGFMLPVGKGYPGDLFFCSFGKS